MKKPACMHYLMRTGSGLAVALSLATPAMAQSQAGTGTVPAAPDDTGPVIDDRLTFFVTGANHWHHLPAYPTPAISQSRLYLDSSGHANSIRGDGRLSPSLPAAGESTPDQFEDDPHWPFFDAITGVKGRDFALDLNERARFHETLVYVTEPFASDVTVLGESHLDVHVSVDAPDPDICVWLADRRPDGRVIMLGFGQLRLRYHAGFEQEKLLEPGQVVQVAIPISHVGHVFAAGHSLCLLVGGSNFPLLDPNPHTGEPVATAVTMRRALVSLFHDDAHPSALTVPVLDG